MLDLMIVTAPEDALVLWGLLESSTEFWLWLGLVLLIVEIFTTGFFLGALSLASFLTAVVATMQASSLWQFTSFAIVSIASLIWIRPLCMKWFGSPEHIPSNVDALVGTTGSVSEQIPESGIGRVQLANEEWRATSDQMLQVGDSVQVTSVDGNTLVVEPAS